MQQVLGQFNLIRNIIAHSCELNEDDVDLDAQSVVATVCYLLAVCKRLIPSIPGPDIFYADNMQI